MTTQNVAKHAKQQMMFWGVAIVIFALLLWGLQEVLTPFVLGFAIAYFLDPLVDGLERTKLPRSVGTGVVLLGFATAFLLACIFVGPILKEQLVQFLNMIPTYVEGTRIAVTEWGQKYAGHFWSQDKLENLTRDYQPEMVKWMTGVLKTFWDGGLALFDVLSVLIITPVVSFYLLRDWDDIVTKVDGWLPKQSQKTIRRLFSEIDTTLAGFIRGQASVCVLLGVIYSVALSLVGLDYAIFIGLFAGIVSFIPYVGSALGFVIGLGVAWFQFDTYAPMAMVGAVFVSGQFIEGNVLTPKLVGEKVGLHAVWVMFALMAGGSLLGFTGVIIAVPVAAVIGVMVRFGLEQYLQSTYYKGSKSSKPKKKLAQKKKKAS